MSYLLHNFKYIFSVFKQYYIHFYIVFYLYILFIHIFKKTKNHYLNTCNKLGVFWVNIAKFKVNLRYRNRSNLFGILKREIEFQYYHCRNSNKSMREKKKKAERENVEFRQWGYQISCAQFCCPGVKGVRGVLEVKRKKKFWQTNCGNAVAEIGKKKICNNCGNDIAENGGGGKCGSEIWGE